MLVHRAVLNLPPAGADFPGTCLLLSDSQPPSGRELGLRVTGPYPAELLPIPGRSDPGVLSAGLSDFKICTPLDRAGLNEGTASVFPEST